MRYRSDSILLGLNRRPYESQSASLSFAAVRFMQVGLPCARPFDTPGD